MAVWNPDWDLGRRTHQICLPQFYNSKNYQDCEQHRFLRDIQECLRQILHLRAYTLLTLERMSQEMYHQCQQFCCISELWISFPRFKKSWTHLNRFRRTRTQTKWSVRMRHQYPGTILARSWSRISHNRWVNNFTAQEASSSDVG